MMYLQTLSWREPLWLLLGLYPLVMLLLIYVLRYFRREQYAEKPLLPWVIAGLPGTGHQHGLRHLASVLAWCCFAIAMAGPRLAEKIYQIDRSHFAEVMIVLDVSPSMAAKDLLPNRLQRARLELLDFLQHSEQHRIGLIVFAARPHLVSPLTHDSNVIQHYLAAMSPSILPTSGSSIHNALRFASRQFTATQHKHRAILLISDGNSTDQDTVAEKQQTIQQLKQLGIHVYSLGIGTLKGEVVVNQLDPRYPQPAPMLTALQQDVLQQVAQQTNGAYTDVSDDNSDWQRLEQQGLARLTPEQTTQQGQHNKILWRELYHLPLIMALVFFLLSLLTSGKRISTSQFSGVSAVILMCLLASHSPPLQATEVSYAQAYEYFQQGNYKKAQQTFARMAGFTARLGEANSLYQQGDYQQARNAYIQATLAATNDQQRATALFNLGNTFYQLTEFVQAQQLYQDVLSYQPTHPAAQANLAHAVRQQRLKQAEALLTYRPGRGPRTAPAADNLDLSNTQVSLGKGSSETELALPTPSSNITEQTSIFEQAALASRQVETAADGDWSYQLTSPTELQTRQQRLQEDRGYVWQRLFEQEEGFPAPLRLPRPVPGISPW